MDDENACALDGWDDHVEQFKDWAETTKVIHDIVKEMHGDTRHLAMLPQVVANLHDIVAETKLLRESLVAPATNRNFLPLAAVIPLVGAMSLCLMILGGLLLVHMSDDRSVKVTPSSIEVEHQ